jgi:PAS domain S-box-containing protein
MPFVQVPGGHQDVARSTESFFTGAENPSSPDGGQTSALADWPTPAAAILDQLQASVITTDLEGNITGCNRATHRLYGYAMDELIGKNVALLRTKPDAADDGFLATVLATGFFQGNILQRIKSGKTIKLFVSISRLEDQNSRPAGIVMISFDPDQSKPDLSALAPNRRYKDKNAEKSGAVSGRAVVVERDIDGTPFIIASVLMHKFMGLVDRVATHAETVLITGETGTGKELVAQTIHKSSFRSNKQFVEINCAALPEHLVESELFGYEKGAFSGADSSKPGLFELADKGTLFLDEIGELPLHIQVKLLRVLDGSAYYRLGGHRSVNVDVRVVAATNQNLEAAVKEGRFRKDLFHRLGQFHLRVPPLRDRPEDVAFLARHFLNLKAPGKGFTEDAVRTLQAHSWPGNIRELRNVITKLAVESAAEEIAVQEVCVEIAHEEVRAPGQETVAVISDLDTMEEQMIVKALEKTGGRRALAAEQLGISRRTLSRKLREYQINAPGRANNTSLGAISWEQQKSYRARVEFPVCLKNAHGEEIHLTAVNLSSRGMGVEGLTPSAQYEGVLEASFALPGEGLQVQAKARVAWAEAEGRAGVKFIAIEPEVLSKLQHWANRKMQEEGWELAQ